MATTLHRLAVGSEQGMTGKMARPEGLCQELHMGSQRDRSFERE